MCQALLPIGVSSEGHSCGPAASQPSVGGEGPWALEGLRLGPPGVRAHQRFPLRRRHSAGDGEAVCLALVPALTA